MTVLAIEITAATNSVGTTTMLRYSDVAYIHPDAPGSGFLEKIDADQSLSIRREMRGVQGGRGEVTFSDLRLINAKGDLDALVGYGFDGREIVGYVLPGSASPWSDRKVLFTATMGPASFDLLGINIPIRDRLAELEQPLHRKTYDGSNTLPDGLEGTEDDIKGAPKPEPEGLILNAQPPFVNTSRLIWEFAAGDREADVTGVFEGGIALTRGTDYTSQSDMENNAPASGVYRVWPRFSSSLEGGYFRLGSSPTHTITCDVQAGATTSDRTVAQVLQALALRAPTISSGDINSTDVSNLDSTLTDPVGYWQPNEGNILRTMETIARGANVWFAFDRHGILRMGIWDTPTNPVAMFKQADAARKQLLADGEFDTASLEGEPTQDSDLPVYDVTVRYKRNYTVQADMQTALSDSRRALVEQEWRRATAKNASVRDKHKNARAVDYDSAWADETAAQDAADRTLARDKVNRRRWRMVVSNDEGLASAVDLADSVTLKFPRLDLTNGKDHRVYRIEYDLGQGTIDYGVWG